MEVKIDLEKKISKKNTKNLVLLINTHNGGINCLFRCKFKIIINRTPKSIKGTIESLGMTYPYDMFDDGEEEAYREEGEQESINSIKDYLKEQFPYYKIKGKIKSTFPPLWKAKPNEYLI